ncbi:MAG: hypothetical protein PHR30_11195 [Gallionellaceae bacterium]|nr:hypothetical protein [Gallionellaceae bacterium]MDD5365897.1 hypothetical protein [Gallionellaceae bacterium]
MKKLLAPIAALFVAAPSYALPIVTLHMGGAPMVDPVLMVAGLSALAAVIAVRVLRRKGGQQ